MLKIFNTLTNQKEKFVPQNKDQVTMYVCGPTVYNYIHIGNGRSAVAFDTVRRYLEYKGYNVKYVSNFTDVDDKMINAAHKNHTTVPKIADKYIKAFYEDTDALNIERATMNPRATDNMTDIIKFVKDLIDNNYAYEVNGDVYFRTRKFKDYGQLSGQNIDELEEGASQHINDSETNEKEDPIDFALWKKQTQPDEIAWDSPWGKGRPGWHIECSVMSTKYLGTTIDIHAGGQDLIFPHHENEIAQSEARSGKKFVNYWMHNGFVTIGKDNEKMSKSLGNFVTVHDLIKKVDPQALRFFMATTQYRRPIQYSDENIEDAKNNLNHLSLAINNMQFRLKDNAFADYDPNITAQMKQIETQFSADMDDDFNVQNGISDVYQLMRLMNNYATEDQINDQNAKELLAKLKQLLGVFGIEFKAQDSLDDKVNALIKKRDQARADKDFAISDQIRDQLNEMGIVLEDTPQGTRWHKK